MSKDERGYGAGRVSDLVGTDVRKGEVPSKGSRRFRLHFQQNRRHELPLGGGRTLQFEPYGVVEVSEAELQSPAIQGQIHMFAVTEV